MKIRILSILLLVCISAVMAQKTKPLTVGDKVPDVVFKTMLNHKAPSGKLSDFKGKAIIIDMWFRECGSCVDAMPHLDSVQKAYKDDLQVLLVTWQGKERIEEFWTKRLRVQNLKFTQAVEDTVMKALFPAVGYPHQIWIDKNGIVKSINDGRQTSKENIDKLINSEKVKIAIKKDELDPYISNAINPMAGIRYPENKRKILHYSYLSEYRQELSGPSGIDTQEHGIFRVKFLSLNYEALYHIAYAGRMDMPHDFKNRIAREDTNSLRSGYSTEDLSNHFCYDLIFRGDSVSQFSKYMIEDLDRYLGFKSHEEIRKIKTLIIRPNGKGIAYKNALLPQEKKFRELGNFKNGNQVVLNKSFINQATLASLNSVVMSNSKLPTVFELPENISVNFKLTWNTNDVAAMNEELQKFDLEAILEDRDTKVIVLKDPN